LEFGKFSEGSTAGEAEETGVFKIHTCLPTRTQDQDES